MKRIFSVAAVFVLLLGLFPGPGAGAAEPAREPAPNFEIRSNLLYLNGSPTDLSHIFTRFEFLLVRKKDYTASLPSQLNAENISAITAPCSHIMPDPQNMLSGSTLMSNLNKVTLETGDVIFGRVKFNQTNNGIAGQWKIITVQAHMFAPSEAFSQDDLPLLSLTDSSLTVTLKDSNSPLARYEYTIVPARQPSGFAPKWIPLGSASEWGGVSKTAAFQPSGSPYTVYVRVEGDDKAGFLRQEAPGIPITSPKVLYSQEKIGPLSGGDSGSVWYFSTDGKKWSSVTAAPGADAFIDLAKVFGKKEISFQLKKASGSTGPEELPTVLEGTLNPRPSYPKGISVQGMASEQYPENWTLTGMDGAMEFSKDGVLWQPLIPDVGLGLLLIPQQASSKPSPYYFRLAPSEAEGIPASAPKKINQPKQPKAPTAKPDYKRETIKLKAGLQYCFAGAGDDVSGAVFETAAGEPIPIDNVISGGQVIYVYTPANGKKPRSAIQKITLAARGEEPDEGTGLVIGKKSASLQKGFEFFGSKDKWGSFTKGDEQGLVRRKATAKYNAKTGINTGLAASVPVKCKIFYTEDAKGKPVAEAVEYERKEGVPLYSWGISAVTGGAYNAYGEDVSKSVVVMNTTGSLVSFSLTPALAPENAALAASIALSLNDKPLAAAESGIYSFTNLKQGDVIKLTVLPKDAGAYGKTTATLTVVPPFEESPKSLTCGSYGSYGDVTVTLASAVPLGQTRTLVAEYVRMPEGKVVHKETKTVAYDPVFNDKVTLDLKQVMASAGPGTYQLRAYIEGSAKTSDSLPVTVSMDFSRDDYFGICFVVMNGAGPPVQGQPVSIVSLRDAFGNVLTGSAFQWYRVYGGARTVITQNANAASYTPVSADAGCSLEVLIYCNERYYTHIVSSQVLPPGSWW